MVGLTELLLIIWIAGCIFSMIIDIPFFVKRDVDNIAAGMFLIMCPVINICYSLYILIRYFSIDYKKFI